MEHHGREESFPNARDCEHGRQRGKCPDCEVAAAEKALAAADRLAEAGARLTPCGSCPVEPMYPGAKCSVCDTRDAARAYLAERGR